MSRRGGANDRAADVIASPPSRRGVWDYEKQRPQLFWCGDQVMYGLLMCLGHSRHAFTPYSVNGVVLMTLGSVLLGRRCV
ncbi:hypothetical protein Scep_003457 [Stephania cephalantha]|uniref:Uncharacterized protein n=1 Tax=Stephania cephalantha TaxID=152367 RepID=A0AAP0KQI7_9MAGN